MVVIWQEHSIFNVLFYQVLRGRPHKLKCYSPNPARKGHVRQHSRMSMTRKIKFSRIVHSIYLCAFLFH